MNINLNALIDPSLDIGVPGGAELLAFSAALIGTDRRVLDEVRKAVAAKIGPAAVAAASAVAANFSKNDRIANGTGIPVDPMVLKMTADIREQIGINAFRTAANTFRHFGES